MYILPLEKSVSSFKINTNIKWNEGNSNSWLTKWESRYRVDLDLKTPNNKKVWQRFVFISNDVNHTAPGVIKNNLF